MFCEKCGAKLNEGDRFCIHCGHEVPYNFKPETVERSEPAAAEAKPEEVPSAEPETSPEPAAVEEAPVPEASPVEPEPEPEPETASEPKPEPELDPAPEESSDEQPSKEKKKKKEKTGKGKTALIIILTILLALVSGFGVFLVVSGTTPAALLEKFRSSDTPQTTEIASTTRLTTKTTRTTTEPTTRTTTEAEEDYGEWYRVSVGSGNRLSFRALPDEDSTKLDRIDNGTRLYITEIRGNWGRTTYDGESGWVCLRKNGDTYCVRE